MDTAFRSAGATNLVRQHAVARFCRDVLEVVPTKRRRRPAEVAETYARADGGDDGHHVVTAWREGMDLGVVRDGHLMHEPTSTKVDVGETDLRPSIRVDEQVTGISFADDGGDIGGKVTRGRLLKHEHLQAGVC